MQVKHNGKIITVGKNRLFPEVMRKISATMTEKHIDMAKLISDGNCSKGIRTALIRLNYIGSAKERWNSYLYAILARKNEYASRQITVRITITNEVREMALKCGDSVSQGIRMALELYGLYGLSEDDPNFFRELNIIKRGLYKKNE